MDNTDSSMMMAPPQQQTSSSSLFQVFLRLRPAQTVKQYEEQWLVVEPPSVVSSPTTTTMTATSGTDDVSTSKEDGEKKTTSSFSTHITLQPPNDSRKRAIERFGFTKIFREDASQSHVFQETGTAECVRNLLHSGRDGLVATLGVTGSGKSHTILGTKSQRGLTQMTLDVLFRSIGANIRDARHADLSMDTGLSAALQACDPSEAQILSATTFLEMVYGDGERARMSRAQTPMNGYVSRAQTPLTDSIASHHTRKPPMPRPSTFAQLPDVSDYAFEVDESADYAVIVSMYEVYNDRIFDLLSNASSPSAPAANNRPANALMKGLTRRPLLFKNTEMSSDRKVVAGLRKIVCSSYDEAIMVLETGLTERRVAGTGSNSVSSRSHGFFCVEVKKKRRTRGYSINDWTGGTLSIVDLAGSERARNAKTTGSTLAEAGKINESLMYLGQCLQVQSDCQQDGSKPIVPFRQCKLTELLFSNSFPSAGHPSTAHRQPQRAVMIVTADPQGDFNATSQILRYSALAREVTVPRVPSITTAIVSGLHKQPGGRSTPNENYFSVQELEQATNEVKKLAEECEALAVRVTEEEIKRTEAEFKLQAAEERLIVNEQDIREECWQEMELTLDEEKERWRAAWEEERVKGENYVDGKIGILEKTSHIKIHSDVDDGARVEELERENAVLRAKIQAMEQEMQTRSPTKKPKTAPKTPAKGLALQESSNTNILTNPFLSSLKARDGGSALRTSNGETPFSDASPRKLSLRNSSATKTLMADNDGQSEMPGTAKKKQRKLTTRKWDLGDPDDF